MNILKMRADLTEYLSANLGVNKDAFNNKGLADMTIYDLTGPLMQQELRKTR